MARRGCAVGRHVERTIVAYEAGRDGFWLARWLRARGVETHIIHPTSVAVSREHRRSKTDRLDSIMLMRVFLGWLRGERGHCSMVAIPTMGEQDAKRPSRERECLVGERTRIINSVKAGLLRLGIRDFNAALRRSIKQLETLVTAEGAPLPPNTLDEMRRDLARLAVVRQQIEAIEADRRARLEEAPATRSNAMILIIARVVGSASRPPTCWCRRSCHGRCETGVLSRVTQASPARWTRVAPDDARKAWRSPATPGFDVA